MFIYKYSQLIDRMSYNDINPTNCSKMTKLYHLGQLKLLMSEITFLSKVSKSHDKVIYVGAAEGYHIKYLADMFPDLMFDLWDKSKFAIDEADNINIFNRYFTDEDAQNYKDTEDTDKILFISDIRNLGIREASTQSIKKYDEIINEDNDKQLRWVQIIRPRYAFLKFRPPLSKGETSYLTGKIYLQPYSPISTETRLFTRNYDELITYDNQEFDEKMAYFNCIERFGVKDNSEWAEIMKENGIKVEWDNIYAMYILSFYLDKIKGVQSKEVVIKEFNNIIDFLVKKYGKKYSVIYNDEHDKKAQFDKEKYKSKIITI